MHAGRAAVEDQRVAVAHQIAHARRNHTLRLEVLLHAALKRRLVKPVRQHHPAMHLEQHTFRDQRLDVATDGFVGYGEDFGQFGDRAGLLRPHKAQDLRLALGRKHTGSERIQVPVSLAKGPLRGKRFPHIPKLVHKGRSERSDRTLKLILACSRPARAPLPNEFSVTALRFSDFYCNLYPHTSTYINTKQAESNPCLPLFPNMLAW